MPEIPLPMMAIRFILSLWFLSFMKPFFEMAPNLSGSAFVYNRSRRSVHGARLSLL